MIKQLIQRNKHNLNLPYLTNTVGARVGDSKAVFTRKLSTLISKCFYHLERYDEAVIGFERVIDINRTFDNTYDMLIQIYIAKGDIEKAKNVIHKAMCYETPWNDHVRQKHLDTLAQFS